MISSTLRATLEVQGSGAALNWVGGAPLYRVQQATDLMMGDWTNLLTDATSPVSLPLESAARFYRIFGH